jgi:hypothetical protein
MKIFWGLFFMAAGAFVVLDQFYAFTNITLLSLLLTIFVVAILIKSLLKLSFTGILFSLAFLAIIYSEPLHLGNITPVPVLLASLFGSIGLSIIFNKHHFYRGCHFERHGHHHRERYSEVINGADGDVVNVDVNFGSSIKYVNSEDFKEANLKSNFGSIKAFFDNAKIKGDTATINIDLSFSGAELYIPKDWKIVNKIDATLGGVDYKNDSNEKAKKTVTLTGRISLSGIEIIYI